jgi:hypothetical protein
VVAAEYQEAFGAHMYDAEGNYIGPSYEYNPEELTEDQQAWAEYYAQHPEMAPGEGGYPEGPIPAEGGQGEPVTDEFHYEDEGEQASAEQQAPAEQ